MRVKIKDVFMASSTLKLNRNTMNLIEQVEKVSVHSKEKSRAYGEVYTPTPLFKQMCDSLSKEIWLDPSKTFLDPCAGNGNMSAVMVTRLMEGLKVVIADEEARYKHIMEKQIYMGEYQRSSARNIEKIFNPDGKLKLNLYVGDFLLIPDDYWNLSYEELKMRYPQHNVWDNTPEAEMEHGKPFILTTVK